VDILNPPAEYTAANANPMTVAETTAMIAATETAPSGKRRSGHRGGRLFLDRIRWDGASNGDEGAWGVSGLEGVEVGGRSVERGISAVGVLGRDGAAGAFEEGRWNTSERKSEKTAMSEAMPNVPHMVMSVQ
jgi:hypothetical protein